MYNRGVLASTHGIQGRDSKVSRYAPSRAPIISASLHSAGILQIALQYLGLPYLSETYIAWPVSENGRNLLVVRWEKDGRLCEEAIPFDNLILSVDQLTILHGWLA